MRAFVHNKGAKTLYIILNIQVIENNTWQNPYQTLYQPEGQGPEGWYWSRVNLGVM